MGPEAERGEVRVGPEAERGEVRAGPEVERGEVRADVRSARVSCQQRDRLRQAARVAAL